ncbi:MAG: RNA-protein complex protein Nop10 [Candidatus Hydrothermarchaeales archaeon]
MMMLYCRACKRYTLKKSCNRCGSKTVNPHPARFSPQDPYGEYRRKLKREVLVKDGRI